MKMISVLFLVSLTSILSVSGTENFTCDFKFGDPTWNYSKVFYNQDVAFPAGNIQHTVVLPGLMTSFVCINLPDADVDKRTTRVFYDPLDHKVSVLLAKNAMQDFFYHIFAKRHGY